MFYVSQELFLIDEKNFERLISLSNVRTCKVELVPRAGLGHWILMGWSRSPLCLPPVPILSGDVDHLFMLFYFLAGSQAVQVLAPCYLVGSKLKFIHNALISILSLCGTFSRPFQMP